VRSITDAHRYLREGPMAMYEKHGFGLWRVSRHCDGVAVGMCGLLKRDNLPDVDIGYAFLPEHWGVGYAFEATEATMRHGAAKFRSSASSRWFRRAMPRPSGCWKSWVSASSACSRCAKTGQRCGCTAAPCEAVQRRVTLSPMTLPILAPSSTRSSTGRSN
jgi:hypothetical protein